MKMMWVWLLVVAVVAGGIGVYVGHTYFSPPDTVCIQSPLSPGVLDFNCSRSLATSRLIQFTIQAPISDTNGISHGTSGICVFQAFVDTVSGTTSGTATIGIGQGLLLVGPGCSDTNLVPFRLRGPITWSLFSA